MHKQCWLLLGLFWTNSVSEAEAEAVIGPSAHYVETAAQIEWLRSRIPCLTTEGITCYN